MNITNTFAAWLMSLTRMMRYFVIAVMFHAALLFVLGSIKIVAYLPRIIASFEDVPLPKADEPEDPTAVYREFEYSGPTLGASVRGRTSPGTRGRGARCPCVASPILRPERCRQFLLRQL